MAAPGRPGAAQPPQSGDGRRRRGGGYPRNPSFDSGILDGAGWNKATILGGERHSAHRAFVVPVRDRANLEVLTDTRVLRLSMEGASTRGVVVHGDGGGIETILAGEVILCAGAFDSPRLLDALRHRSSGAPREPGHRRRGRSTGGEEPDRSPARSALSTTRERPISESQCLLHRGLRLHALDPRTRRLRPRNLLRQGAALRARSRRRRAPFHDHPGHHPAQEPRHCAPHRGRS